MTAKTTTVGVLFGGQSAEHEISIKSTRALIKNLDRERFTPILIYISRDGRWHPVTEQDFQEDNFALGPGYGFLPWENKDAPHLDADFYFPMLHGPNGEDGKIQGLLEMSGKPFAGAGSVASAVAMDKVVSKHLFKSAGLKVGDFLYFETNDFPNIREQVSAQLGYPVFVKPSFMGSSIGISKANDDNQLKTALDLAFQYGSKVIIEKGLDVREIEVSVMGNSEIMVSRPGELIPYNEFYDYKDKYIDGKTTFHMPAHLDEETESKLRDMAGKAYKALFMNGMSRVDLFIEKNSGDIYINELNTIPGFTEISMFPKLWTLQDISFKELISRLIDYGFDYHRTQQAATNVPELDRAAPGSYNGTASGADKEAAPQ